jgi:CRP-like cAMP-binding protein
MSDEFYGLFEHDGHPMTLEPGQFLFHKGDDGRHMYVVTSGELEIVDGKQVFETISPGGILGEMALLDERHVRSASARAVDRCTVVPIDERGFLAKVQQSPFFAIKVMRVMGGRLRAMNQRAGGPRG